MGVCTYGRIEPLANNHILKRNFSRTCSEVYGVVQIIINI